MNLNKALLIHKILGDSDCKQVGGEDSKGFKYYYCKGKANGCARFNGTVWGTDVYTGDSSKCCAGLHYGAFRGLGGLAKYKDGPRGETFTGTCRNGVTTSSYGSYGTTFTFVKFKYE